MPKIRRNSRRRTSSKIEKLLRELEQKTKEAAEANEKYLRTYADFENYRKRMQRDLADFRKYANEQLALELLSVVDHLGLALKHAGEAGETAQRAAAGRGDSCTSSSVMCLKSSASNRLPPRESPLIRPGTTQ